MSENLKDILSNLNPDIDQETLLQYLQGKLSPQEQHELEKQILDNEFAADAIDGLQDFKDKIFPGRPSFASISTVCN